MKKILISSLVITSSVFAWGGKEKNKPIETPVIAQAAPQKVEPVCPPPPHMSVTLGGDYTWANVKVNNHGTFKGHMVGAQGMFEFDPMNAFYAGILLNWRYGWDLHDASGKRTLHNLKAQEGFGYTASFWCDKGTLSLFTGLGYRMLSHGVSLKDSIHMRMIYNTFYVPVGFKFNYAVNSFFSMGLNGTWLGQIYSGVALHPLGGAYWKLKRMYKNFLVELPLSFNFGKTSCLSFILNPSFELWQDGQSTAKTSTGVPLGIPKNTYILWGGELNIKYRF